MDDVARWLSSLGLSQYATAFADSQIEFSLLVELTDDDLKEPGIIVLGHRRKVTRAINELRAKAGQQEASPGQVVDALPDSQVQQAEGERVSVPESSPNSRGRAERRHLTVMFCDLVG